MKSKNDLVQKIWKYLILFTLLILGFICIFQLVFFDTYYIYSKSNSLNNIADKIEESVYEDDFTDTLNNLAYVQDVCILITDDKDTIYSSSGFNRSCFLSPSNAKLYQENRLDFINSDESRKSYNVDKGKNVDEMVLLGLKMDDGNYAFVLTSLEPVSATTSILSNQIFIVSILALILSSILAYFISKIIGNPIININKKVQKMSNGNYDVDFSTKSDITEIVELSQTLDKTQNELKRIEEVRKELLANVSHDLKTPLTMIRAYTEMVRDITFDDTEKRNKNLNIVISETERLNALVNDVLELSKMQSNVTELDIKEFDFNELMVNIIDKFSYSNIIFEYKNNKKLLVLADSNKIERVLYNLISNAIGHAGDDNIIEIKITSKKDVYLVEIKDHGEGIDKNNIDLIWDKYYRIDKTHQRSTKGTGLGLSIVKSILVKHDFYYGVKTSKKGTTFYFEIKRA